MSGLDSYLASHKPIPAEGAFSDGQLLGEWRITAFLGKGGSAEVYQVENVRTGALAAAKILMKDEESARKRFGGEVEFLQTVAGDPECRPYPVCYDVGECDGRPFAVMELLEQVEIPADEDGIAAYLLEVCSCVCDLHRRGFVHRDLKPENVMRRSNGEMVLIDFGLAKDRAGFSLPRKDVSLVSGKLVGMGTPDYAAPEQFLGGDITPAADIHALGVLVEKLTVEKSEGWLSRGGGVLARAGWKKIIRRATSSIPSERYQSVDEFAAAIRHRNRGRRIATCALAFALLAGGAVLAGLLGRRLPEEIAWDRLCGEQVTTNVVQEETISVTWLDKDGLKIPAERRYRIVTNRVEVVPIQLNGVTNAFTNPIRLKGGREYWVTGPGVLDGTFLADGTNVTMRLRSCIVRNHAAEPLGKVGISYDLQDGAGLDLPELDEPDDHGRHYIERSGSPTRLNFKKIDWGEPVIMKDEQGTGL